MTPPNGSVETYARGAKWLHWLVALGVFIMVPVGLYMVQRGARTNYDDLTNTLFSAHKLTGFLILWLVAARIVYRARNGAPAPAATLTRFERVASSAVHHLLYVLLVATPLLGLAGVSAYGAREVFGLFSLPQILPEDKTLGEAILKAHGAVALLMAALVAVHIGGALMHGIIKQDGVMNRMIGWWPLRR